MQLTQNQIDTLRNKGLTDDKIKALALHSGYSMPEHSTIGAIGSSLIKSEKGFGQSYAGAVGEGVLSGTKSAIDQANQMAEQVQTNLIKRIKEKRARGEDTSRLIGALKTLDKEVNFYDILNESTGGSLDKSAKQVLGEGLGIVTDIASAGVLPGAVGQATKAKTIGQGIIEGAKFGATGGAILGAGQGVSRSAQENKTAGEIVGSGIRSGIEGGIAGGVVGGALGGISGWLNGRTAKINKQEEDFIHDLVSPKATEKVKQQALKEGRVTEQGLLKASKITPSKRDIKLAEAVKGVVSPKLSPIQNIEAIDNTVSDINTGVKAYVAEHKVPFNTNQLKSQLNSGKDELKLIFASDTNAEKTYNAVVDEFMSHVKSMDTSGLLDARQAVDKIPAIKKLLDSKGLGENVKKEVVLTLRDKANSYVASLLPKDNHFREALLRESRMIEAMKNIAEKNTDLIGKNALQSLAQKYPILKWLIGGLGVGIVGSAGVGVGSTIIGSTD